jgi:hypothetical protein
MVSQYIGNHSFREDCTQEESILAATEEKLGDEDNQDLETHARKGKRKKEVHSYKKYQGSHKTHKCQNDYSNYK